MKKIFCIFFYSIISVLLCLATANAQMLNQSFKLEIDSLPGFHIWDNYTDYNETGHLTHSYGSEDSYVFFSQYMQYDDKYTIRSGDTLTFSVPDGHLQLIFDVAPLSIRKLTLDRSYFYGDYRFAYVFNIDNVKLTETSSTFDFKLSGDQILHHNFFDSSYDYNYILSGNQSFTKIYSTKKDSVVSGSFVSFSITKDHFQNSNVTTNASSSNISISPNPTTGIITVYSAPENLTSVIVINVLGEKVLELANPHSFDFTIDLSKLVPGMYYARFLAGNSVVVKKIIKE